jgi:hypothetical protein
VTNPHGASIEMVAPETTWEVEREDAFGWSSSDTPSARLGTTTRRRGGRPALPGAEIGGHLGRVRAWNGLNAANEEPLPGP